MRHKIHRFLGTLTPFFIITILFTILFGLLTMLAYLLIWGVCIGTIFWGITLLKKNLFRIKRNNIVDSPIVNKEGRIIEHIDIK